MSQAEQLTRMILSAGGAYFFGDAVANGELYQAAISGVVAIGAWGWWLYRQRKAK